MSNESPEPLKTDYSDSAWKIRSKHRRRLLDRLTEGGATVSVLARDVKLRVPHASAEIKRLINDGLGSSDLSVGSRGARIHLTELGWKSVSAVPKNFNNIVVFAHGQEYLNFLKKSLN